MATVATVATVAKKSRPKPAARPLPGRPARAARPRRPGRQISLPVGLLLALLSATAAVVVFGRAAGFQFLTWDDPELVSQNAAYAPATLASLAQFWRQAYLGLYIPVTSSVWWLEARVAGLNPAVFHTVNVLLHAANAALVFLVVRELLAKKGDRAALAGATVGGLLFAVHPFQVEAVAWVTAMKDLLSTLFALLGALAYLRAASRPGGPLRYWPPGAGWFLLALLAKPAVALFGPALAVLDVGLRRTPWRVAARRLAPWLVLAVPFAIVTKQLQPDAMLWSVPPLWLRPFVALDALQFYLTRLVAPVGLAPEYGRSPAWLQTTGEWRSSLAVPLLVAAAAALAAYRGRRQPAALAAALAVVLAPVLGLVPFLYQNYSTVADHYMYLAMLVVAVAAGLAVAAVPAAHLPKAAAVGLVVCLALAGLSLRQLGIWRDDATFFSYGLAENPSSPLLAMNWGSSLFDAGRYEESVAQFRQAALVHPHADIYNNLGSALLALGRYEESRDAFLQAHQMNPSDPVIERNLERAEAQLVR